MMLSSDPLVYCSLFLLVPVLVGLRLLSSPRTAVLGNRLGGAAVLAAILIVLGRLDLVRWPELLAALLLGTLLGARLAQRVTMPRMPQLVALLNGFGGLASLLIAWVAMLDPGRSQGTADLAAAFLALAVGGSTFSGSMIAAAKLDQRITSRPVVFPGQGWVHSLLALMLLALAVAAMLGRLSPSVAMAAAIVVSWGLGLFFALRVGGADMPVAIALLNSLSGLAAAISGFVVRDPLLVTVGAVVGSSGLILTRIMCSAMNRSLGRILAGRTAVSGVRKTNGRDPGKAPPPEPAQSASGTPRAPAAGSDDPMSSAVKALHAARRVIIVPGYGLAVAQAQHALKTLYDVLCSRDQQVDFAIHPVAGRMPGHMNVLLAEVDIPYERLRELDEVNPEFESADVVLAVGACDVINPAAVSAEGTPIHGMPILHVDRAACVIVCNLDRKPGYSGVDNVLYDDPKTVFLEGNAAETLSKLHAGLISCTG